MMIDLEEATRALRDETDGASVGARQTHARIMRSLHENKHHRRVRWGFGVPLAIIFAGGTAFAGARGDLGEAVSDAIASVRALVSPAPAKPTPPRAPRGAARSAPVAAPAEEPPTAAPLVEPNVEEAPALTEEPPAVAPPVHVPPPLDAPPARKPDPSLKAPSKDTLGRAPRSVESELATQRYRKAHDAQFVDGDCARAVTAYDEYLASAPTDRLVPEARYNRALCLVRLGRVDSARSALQPFASGAYGEFRRREARELLDALGGNTPTTTP